MRRRKWLIVVVCVVAGIPIVLGGIGLLLLCNPMLLMFLSSFEIRNDSGVDVWVTPIGRWEGTGDYGPLPRYWNRTPPAIPSWQDHDIPLEAGGRLTVIYDWDDINFRHLLVRTADEEVYITDTDKKGTLDYCYAAQESSYRIPPVKEMPKVPDELLPCTRGKHVQYSGAVDYPSLPMDTDDETLCAPEKVILPGSFWMICSISEQVLPFLS